MSANAYVLTNTEPAATQRVVEKLRIIAGARVQEVLGPYDMVLELEADSQEDINVTLRNKIRSINGVTNTVTVFWS